MPTQPLDSPFTERRIARDELSRDPAGVLEAVHRGDAVVVEYDGQPEVAIIDIIDFQILRAALSFHPEATRPDPDAGLAEEDVEDLSAQQLYNLVLAYYLADAISLARAAELLQTSWVELRRRFTRLGVPVWTAPEGEEGVRQDLLVARSAAP